MFGAARFSSGPNPGWTCHSELLSERSNPSGPRHLNQAVTCPGGQLKGTETWRLSPSEPPLGPVKSVRSLASGKPSRRRPPRLLSRRATRFRRIAGRPLHGSSSPTLERWGGGQSSPQPCRGIMKMGTKQRINEAEIVSAVKKYLFDAGGTATIGQIRRALPHFADLGSCDRIGSQTRPGEEIWEQQVRNIVCHRDGSGNPIKDGEIRWSPGQLTLADGPQKDLF